MRLMRLVVAAWIATSGISVLSLRAQDQGKQARAMELKGDGAEARTQLQRAANAAPNDPLALEAYAEFLDHHRDPQARAAYEKLRQLLARNGASAASRMKVTRRLAELDLIAGDRASAEKHIEEFRSVGGKGVALPAPNRAGLPTEMIEIPGPLRSFARMAAVSPDISIDDVMSALSHNITLNGYSALRASESLEPTEYLKLVQRYLAQAREIEKLAGPEKVLKIETCESTQTGDLLRILGYRMRGNCGGDVALETVNPSRAFLTIDSGFPLSPLEAALRTNRPFTLDYHPARVPVLFSAEYWHPVGGKAMEFIDFFMADPALCRLYTAMSTLDPDTADLLHKDMPAAKAKVYAHVWDFFGSMMELRDNRAVVPGGTRSERAWTELLGVGPDKGITFFERLVEKDDGWLASYFDSLARISGPVQTYLTDPDRLKRIYTAMRGRVTSPGPARPVFRANTDLVLLTTRMRLDADGKPHLPGGINVWKNLFSSKSGMKLDPVLAKAAPGWREPEQVLEAMFGLSRKVAENEPLKIFMALTDVERNRAKPLEPNTVDLLVREFREFGAQYPLFAEVPSLSDATVTAYLEAARAITAIKDIPTRADAAGTMQALASFWQIFVRQRAIPVASADAALASAVQPFAKIQAQREIFDAGQKGLQALLVAARAPSGGSVQDHLMDLLAGTRPAGSARLSDAHTQMLQDMTKVFEAQRLISLDTLFGLADRLEAAAAGTAKLDLQAANRLAGRITEIQLPRAALSTREHAEQVVGYYADRHVDGERRMNLRQAIERAGSDPQKLRDIRASLAPALRDTLVGLNYVHYAPPGAQVLFTNPSFVRGHDFYGTSDHIRTWQTTEVLGTGWPANAGGRLSGSLIALPYALASAEQNFLIPSREQALIWGDLVPQMILTAVVPRWWDLTPAQLHWVGLNMAYAESLLARAALEDGVRDKLRAVLDRYMPPARLKKVDRYLAAGDVRGAAENVVPAEMYLAARELAPADRDSGLAEELRTLASSSAQELSPVAISHTFGTPKPTLSTSYQPELLSLRTFPTLMGYSSRIMAESWESNLLFYAALADELHLRPAELNLRIPEWTQQTVERIFATHLEDWPALLRSLRMVGDDVRQKARKTMLAQN